MTNELIVQLIIILMHYFQINTILFRLRGKVIIYQILLMN